MKIAILGWGSLIWDFRSEFDKHHEEWQFDGPSLPIEFSRVSESRNGALTLVIDENHGEMCRVAYAFSKRVCAEDAICDLRCREGTVLKYIGSYFADNSQTRSLNLKALESVRAWAVSKDIDVAIWTDLPSNFGDKSKVRQPFSVQDAISHIQLLENDGKISAVEYVWRAPDFVDTPLRRALQSQPWFSSHG